MEKLNKALKKQHRRINLNAWRTQEATKERVGRIQSLCACIQSAPAATQRLFATVLFVFIMSHWFIIFISNAEREREGKRQKNHTIL